MLRTSLRWREVLGTAATIAVAVVWFVALRPVALGGPASYIVVHGHSMSGALAPGDLFVTMAQGAYSIGDAIVYRVPSGAGQGLLVVHRIIGVDSAGYTMQGDANSYQDPWRPKTSDVLGRLVVTLPGFGRYLSSLANPYVLAGLWALVALILGLSFLPRSPSPKSDLSPNPKVPNRRHLQPADAVNGSVALAVAIRIGADHPALDTATGWAIGILVGLVMVSADVTLSPAYAAGLQVNSIALTAQDQTRTAGVQSNIPAPVVKVPVPVATTAPPQAVPPVQPTIAASGARTVPPPIAASPAPAVTPSSAASPARTLRPPSAASAARTRP